MLFFLLTFAAKITITMTEKERKDMKAASDSGAFSKHLAADVARYAREWTPSSASNTMPWNANGLGGESPFIDKEAIAERNAVHDHACSLVSSVGLSGERGLAAYNVVAEAYAAFIKKGTAVDSDLDPSSVISFDEFYSRINKA